MPQMGQLWLVYGRLRRRRDLHRSTHTGSLLNCLLQRAGPWGLGLELDRPGSLNANLNHS